MHKGLMERVPEISKLYMNRKSSLMTLLIANVTDYFIITRISTYYKNEYRDKVIRSII